MSVRVRPWPKKTNDQQPTKDQISATNPHRPTTTLIFVCVRPCASVAKNNQRSITHQRSNISHRTTQNHTDISFLSVSVSVRPWPILYPSSALCNKIHKNDELDIWHPNFYSLLFSNQPVSPRRNPPKSI